MNMASGVTLGQGVTNNVLTVNVLTGTQSSRQLTMMAMTVSDLKYLCCVMSYMNDRSPRESGRGGMWWGWASLIRPFRSIHRRWSTVNRAVPYIKKGIW